MAYNRIMAYNVNYNGLTFVNNPLFKKHGGILCLKEFGFFEVATNSSSEKYAIRHGEYVSPTQLKNRRVKFLFDIIADTEEERRALLKRVQRAFTPELNPSPFNENLRKELSFLDVDCVEWKCKCQVLRGVQLSDFANERRVGISVELITDSPYFYSDQEFSATAKNTLAGIKLPVKLPFYRAYHQKLLNIDYTGIADTPLKIIMKIIDNDDDNFPYDKIKVIHQTGDKQEILYIDNVIELGLSVGDKIILDAENRRCYYESNDEVEDISGLVEAGSNRPSLSPGSNLVSIDTGIFENECIEATIKWQNLF